MARKAKKQTAVKQVRRRRSRLQREQLVERLIIYGVIVVAVLVVGSLGFGLIYERVVKPRRPVANVDGVRVTEDSYDARLAFRRAQLTNQLNELQAQRNMVNPAEANSELLLQYIDNSITQVQTQLLSMESDVLEQLIEDELVRQEAARRGISVPPDELQQEIEKSFGYDRNPPTPVPTLVSASPVTPATALAPDEAAAATPTPMTEEAFLQRYDDQVKAWRSGGISESRFRAWFEVALLTQKLVEQMGDELPTEEEQVNVRYLVVDSEEQADELAARLDAGEDFQVLLDELNADEEGTGYGSEIGWLPRGELEQGLGAEVADLAFSLDLGAHSAPVLDEETETYSIIEVVGHELHELDEWLRDQRVDEAYGEWLASEKELKVERLKSVGLGMLGP